MGSYLLSFRVVGLLLRQSETAADKRIANGSVIRNLIDPGLPISHQPVTNSGVSMLNGGLVAAFFRQQESSKALLCGFVLR
jgi:hypothetical protein